MVSDSITGPNPTMATVPHESSGAYLQTIPRAESALEKLQAHFPDIFFEARRFRDELTLYVPRERIVDICRFCKNGPDMGYDYLSDLTGNDWPERDPRFEVIYQLYSMQHFTYLRLKVRVPEDDLTVPSVTSVWQTSNWHERETFDLFGIRFDGHPDLRRILLSEDWNGHPLRQTEDISWEEPEFTVRKVPRVLAKS